MRGGYSVGILADGNRVSAGCEEAYLDYLRFRARVYAYENDFISRELILDDGTEKDEDDSRSIHFGVVENQCNNPRVVAAMRVILKNDLVAHPLPIEKYFPNLFANEPIGTNNVEVSRYICQHNNRTVQFALTWPLFSAGFAYAIKNNMGTAYAVLEPVLERVLIVRGLPIIRLADPEFVPRYNTTNIPVNFNIKLTAKIIDAKNPGLMDKLGNSNGKFVHFGICNQKGILYENN